MIELKNISTLDLVGIEAIKKNPKGLSKKNFKLIKENKITNYQELRDFYDKLHSSVSVCKPEVFCETDGLKKFMLDTEEAIKYSYREPELFEYDEFNDVFFDHDIVDKNTAAIDLLYGSPLECRFNDSKKRNKAISPFSVYELKQCLTHCDTYGKNLLKSLCKIYDNEEIKRILVAIAMYEEQLQRQVLELNGHESKKDIEHLFDYNSFEKYNYILKQIKEISDYFTVNAKELVWENEPGKDISRLRFSVYNHSLQDVRNREIVSSALSKYVSLEEAKNGLVRTKTLDRFIVK